MHYSLTGNRLVAAPGFFDAPSLRGQGGDMPSPPKKNQRLPGKGSR